MSIKATNLKSSVLNTGKKIGLLVATDSPVDRAIDNSTKVAADVYNEGEKQTKKLVVEAKSKLDQLRAKIHEATAPKAAAKAPAPKAAAPKTAAPKASAAKAAAPRKAPAAKAKKK
jgi:hypothetical protein